MSVGVCMVVLLVAFAVIGYFYIQKKNAIPERLYEVSNNPDYLGIDMGESVTAARNILQLQYAVTVHVHVSVHIHILYMYMYMYIVAFRRLRACMYIHLISTCLPRSVRGGRMGGGPRQDCACEGDRARRVRHGVRGHRRQHRTGRHGGVLPWQDTCSSQGQC